MDIAVPSCKVHCHVGQSRAFLPGARRCLYNPASRLFFYDETFLLLEMNICTQPRCVLDMLKDLGSDRELGWENVYFVNLSLGSQGFLLQLEL